MHHDTPLITTIVAGLVLAYIFGMIANRFKMPPLVGYLFAGVLAGPYTPGFVADQAVGAELAELGVILLMFGVGLHFSLKDLLSVRALAIPGAVGQIALATLLGFGLGSLLGWDMGASLLFGLALSCASTVVLLKAMQDRRLLETERGRIAVGWLIVEDLVCILALVLIPAFAALSGSENAPHDPFVSFVERLVGGGIGIWGVIALTAIKIAGFVGFMLIVGRRIIPWALHGTAHTGSRELFRLAVLAIALGVALGSAVLFGVSLALGAFFAGMILSESELSHRAAQETLPLRDAFSVLFFVSVGMLFDPTTIVEDPLPLLATVFIIVIGKSLAAFGIVLLFRRPVSTALTISASLAQIGEFSFIIASMGVALAIMPKEAQDLVLAGSVVSIILNPVVFWAVDLAKPRLEAKAAARKAAQTGQDGPRIEPGELSEAANGPITSDAPSEAAVDSGAPGADDDTGEPSHQTGHTVLVGYGQVGRILAAGIKEDGGGLVVIEDSDHDVAAARAEGLEVVFGNAASLDTLRLANLPQARNLLIAISNAFEAGTVCESGRKLNPGISIIARAYSEEEEDFLRNLGATAVIRGEREIGKGILTFLRGDGGDMAAPAMPVPEEPKLPVVENLLEKAAAAPVVAEVVATEPETVIELPPPADEAPAGEETEPAPVEAIGEAPAAIDEVVVPPPVEPVAETPAETEAEPEIEPDAAPDAEPEPQPDTPAEPEPETAAEIEAETEREADDETNEGGIAPPVDDSETEERNTVPPVVPEPKS
ncbi:sodium:proton antiporter [Devosia ginsengisoli]|uniref:Sodium:proton antiporter n=1 Tax=Devosia ginsengisoli TaxID=400770 RepID=A0A5B8LWS0_9HYPH|nr:sodium:proton antiporter [Devosia ginsengisoli]